MKWSIISYTLILYLSQYKVSLSVCPNECNAKGICDKYSRCTCADGYLPGDCSLRICPYGAAWSDFAQGNDLAHKSAECSNRGLCDRTTGECKCHDGFTGTACERLTCQSNCNNNGKCVSLTRKAADTRNDLSQKFYYDQIWDGSKIFGCLCDVTNQGYDCSEWVCPNGDDPLTQNQVNEVQLVVCTAVQGTFVLFFRGFPSATIPYYATAGTVRTALLQIPSVTDVDVKFSQGVSACNATANVITVEFTEQFGVLPPLVGEPDADMQLRGGAVTVYAHGAHVKDSQGKLFVSITGTKEADPCAYRGICDTTSGTCECFDSNGDAYASSDGYGEAGTRGDCGFVVSAGSGEVDSCPSEIQCSGHGVCAGPSYRCACAEGWTSGDCSERTCPNGLSWFSYPSAENTAHDIYSECADMGICDRNTGVCNCHSGFFGQSCEYMECGGDLDAPCWGHGKCLSMAELALSSESNGDATDFTYGLDPNNPNTWDSQRIFGCACDYGFEGYDCSLKSCPKGDDPGTYDDHVEVQLLSCTATGGWFRLKFRQQYTPYLHHNITALELQQTLMKLPSINGPITVKYGNLTSIHHSACTNRGDVIIIISFDTVHGSLPPLTADISKLENGFSSNGNPGTGVIKIATDGMRLGNYSSIDGTTEFAECNNRGLCDHSTGICSCFAGWASSDGKGGLGDRGDCGYRKTDLTPGAKCD